MRLGQAVLASGSSSAHRVFDGYVFKATKADPQTVIVTVLDAPSVYAFMAWNNFGGLQPTLVGLRLGNRDNVSRRDPTLPVDDVDAVVLTDAGDFANSAYYVLGGNFPPGLNIFGQGGANHSARWVVNVTSESDAADATLPNRRFSMVIRCASGVTKFVPEGTANANAGTANQNAYVIEDRGLQALTGNALLHLAVRSSASSTWQPYTDMQVALRATMFPLGGDYSETLPQPFVFTAQTHEYGTWSSTPSANQERVMEAGLLVLRVTPLDVVLPPGAVGLATPAYTRAYMLRSMGYPDLVPSVSPIATVAGQTSRNMVVGHAVVVGADDATRVELAASVAFEEVVDLGSGPQLLRKTTHRLLAVDPVTNTFTSRYNLTFAEDADSAGYFSVPLKPDFQTEVYLASAQAQVEVLDEQQSRAWIAKVVLQVGTVSGVWPSIKPGLAETVLVAPDGSEVVTGLRAAGYVAVIPKLEGTFSVWGNVDNYGTLDFLANNAVFDIGNNQLGVLAYSLTAGSTLTPELVVISALDGSFVEARGALPSFPTLVGHSVTGSCVLRQTTTRPAVLLACVARYAVPDGKRQYVSTDGGATWTAYAKNVHGTPYYLGNQLHPAFIGHEL